MCKKILKKPKIIFIDILFQFITPVFDLKMPDYCSVAGCTNKPDVKNGIIIIIISSSSSSNSIIIHHFPFAKSSHLEGKK